MVTLSFRTSSVLCCISSMTMCFVLELSAKEPPLSVVGRASPPSYSPRQATPEALPAPSSDNAPREEEVTIGDSAPTGDWSSVPADQAWRYRFHLSRWWYFVEPGHWLFWDGHCWQDAQPQLPKVMPDGTVTKPGPVRRILAAWPQVPSYREHHGWVGGFYSSGGGYGDSAFGYGYGVPNYGPGN